MAVTAPTSGVLDPGFVSAFRAGSLTAARVDAALPHDRSAAIFVLLQLSTLVATGAAELFVDHIIQIYRGAPQPDHYEVLQVSPNASPEVINAAYRRLAAMYHPDRNPGDPGATARMAQLNDAYAVLSDSDKRHAYDARRRAQSAGRSAESPPPTATPPKSETLAGYLDWLPAWLPAAKPQFKRLFLGLFFGHMLGKWLFSGVDSARYLAPAVGAIAGAAYAIVEAYPDASKRKWDALNSGERTRAALRWAGFATAFVLCLLLPVMVIGSAREYAEGESGSTRA